MLNFLNKSVVKDLDLAEWGRKEIDLAKAEMPGLTAISRKFKNLKPLKGERISGCLHLTIQTAVLIETLLDLGAEVRWCSCNVNSTQDHAAAAIAYNNDAKVFAWKYQNMSEYWWCINQALIFNDQYLGPTLIIDDGGDMTDLILHGLDFEKNKNQFMFNKSNTEIIKQHFEKYPSPENRWLLLLKNLKGIAEETTTGINKIRKILKEDSYPICFININDSITKSKFDNIYGCRHSLIDSINRSLDLLLSGKSALILGYGDVGKGCAESLRGQKMNVYISEIDPICALQAQMEGYQVVKIESVINKCDLFVTATGNVRVITLDHMRKMKDNAILCNIGHDNNEIDIEALESNSKKINIKQLVDLYYINNNENKKIIVLAEGRLVNLGCATGHPSFVMSTSFSNQVMGMIELAHNKGNYSHGLNKLSKKIQEEIAKTHVEALNGELTVLTHEQSNYLGLNIDGPFKQDDYKY